MFHFGTVLETKFVYELRCTCLKMFLSFKQEIIRQATSLLDSLDGVTQVHGPFYDMSSNYHKLMGNHAEYYRDALRYLGCTDINTISSKWFRLSEDVKCRVGVFKQ